MAAVHFVITIPTETAEISCSTDLSCTDPQPDTITRPSTQLTLNPPDTADVCIENSLQYGTFPTRSKSETGDIIVNGATRTTTRLDIEAGVNQPCIPTSWGGLRDMMSSARKTKEEESHDLDLPPDTCMEIVLRKLLQIFQIDNAVWTMDNDKQRLQVSFTVDHDDNYEKFMEELTSWGIGYREGSTVSAMNCISYITSSRQADNHDESNEQNITLQKESAWDRFINSIRRRMNVAQIVRDVRREAEITFDFIVLVISAGILASFGLVEDSSIFLAASMLISPLMGPIIAAIFGTVIKDYSLQTLGLCNELLGILIATTVGFAFGLVVGSLDEIYGVGQGLTNEMLARCDLHSLVVGIFTALASGAAAAVGVLGGNIGSLIGVAISASLLPPAVNSGLLWALALLNKFHENDNPNPVPKNSFFSDYHTEELLVLGILSMCLTILNVICVFVMGIVVLKIKEIAPVSQKNREFWKHDIKIARDLHRNDLNTDDAGLTEEDQKALFHSKHLFRSSYQNTWSPSGCHTPFESYPVPPNFTVGHYKTLNSDLNKRSSSPMKCKGKSNMCRRSESQSVDTGCYHILKENIPTSLHPAAWDTNSKDQPLIQFPTEPSNEVRRGRHFIVTPVTSASNEIN